MALYSASIDDNDPTVIYSSGWVLITSDPPWTGTMHSTSIPGSYARFRFTGMFVRFKTRKFEESAHLAR